MRLHWDEFSHETASSDFDWAGLAVSSYDTLSARQVAGAKPRRLDGDDEIGSSDFSFAPSASSLTASPASFVLTPDDTLSPPVGAPAADVARKWNFDGAGRDDLVFRASNSRDIIVLASNGTRYLLAAPAGYRLVGAADFTGDGIADLLFSSVSGASADNYLVKVVTNTAGVPTIPGTGDFTFNPSLQPGRIALCIGDFNGDGKTDLVRRDAYDGSGDVNIALNSGSSLTGSFIQSPLSFNWSLAGVGDINGDGRDDLIWRNSDDTLAAWLMGSNGLAFTSVGLASVGHEWKLEAVTRLNGNDQINDLVWRNVVSGRTIGWIMDAVAGISSVVELGTYGFDLEYVGAAYSPTTAGPGGNGGINPQLLWRRTDGSTLGTVLSSAGTVDSATGTGDVLLSYPNATETHFRTRLPETFDFGVRSMWGPNDVLEPMRTRNFSGMGASGGNTGRIPLVQANGGLTVLFAAGGGLTQFTPQATAGGNFSLARNMVLMGMGDFNGDGIGIDLFYRDSLASFGGFVATWNAATGTYGPGVGLLISGHSVDSRIIGFGQIYTSISGDEIVSQNRDGLVCITGLLKTGGIVSGTNTGFSRIQSRDWIGQGVIDLDGNGIADIVWRNAKTGSISYWSMNSSNVATINEVFINTTPVTNEWDLVGMGDLDGDGDGDLIWRRNTDGFVVTWLFAGGQLGSVAGITGRGWDWRFEGTSDVNGDGKTDLVWRNASGQYAADLMNGATVTSTIFSGAITFDRATMGWNQAFMRSL
jgi:FG-GAP-like repeat